MNTSQSKPLTLIDILQTSRPQALNLRFPSYEKLQETVLSLQQKQEKNDIQSQGRITPVMQRARAMWEEARLSRNFSALKDTQIKYLCVMPEVVVQEDFLTILNARSEKVRDRAVIPLMLSCHSIWKIQPQYMAVAAWLRSYLPQYQGRAKCVEVWRRSIDLLLTDEAPQKLAIQLIEKMALPKELSNKYSLILESSGFVKDVTRQAVQSLCDQLVDRSNLSNESSWKYLFESLFPLLADNKYDLCNVLARLIIATKGYIRSATISLAQEMLKQFILSNNSLKDPRIYPSNWIGFDDEAKGIFINWLSTEEIELFFEVIIREGRTGRKAFWLRYLSKIQDSVVVIGKNDKLANREKLDNLKRSGRSFSDLSNDSINSAFILDFGQIVVVEFSESGRAYIYEKQIFIQRQSSNYVYREEIGMRRKVYSVHNLKDAQRPIHALAAISHSGTWENELSNCLARHGVRSI